MLAGIGVQACTQLLECRDIDLLDVREVRDAPLHVLQPFGDPAPQPDDAYFLDAVPFGARRGRWGDRHSPALTAGRNVGVEILVQDASARAAAAYGLERDA